MNHFASWIATLGPVGKIKYAPGTFGSLCAIPIIYWTKEKPEFLVGLFIIFTLTGVWASGRVARNMKIHDPSCIIIDEVCGMLITFLFVPINWYFLGIGFICFRFFDIMKPPPIRFLEKAPGGIGIVLDDLGAGLFANIILQIIFHYA